jgi:hypothetical protein
MFIYVYLIKSVDKQSGKRQNIGGKMSKKCSLPLYGGTKMRITRKR